MQILVEVANSQMKTLTTEVSNGLISIVFRDQLLDFKDVAVMPSMELCSASEKESG